MDPSTDFLQGRATEAQAVATIADRYLSLIDQWKARNPVRA